MAAVVSSETDIAVYERCPLDAMEEDEALRNYCRRRISVVRGKQQKCGSSGRERRRRKDQTTSGRKSTEGQRRAVEGETFSVVGTSPGTERCCVAAQPVPVQLITRLRLKTVQGNMTRVIIVSFICFVKKIKYTTDVRTHPKELKTFDWI